MASKTLVLGGELTIFSAIVLIPYILKHRFHLAISNSIGQVSGTVGIWGLLIAGVLSTAAILLRNRKNDDAGPKFASTIDMLLLIGVGGMAMGFAALYLHLSTSGMVYGMIVACGFTALAGVGLSMVSALNETFNWVTGKESLDK